MFNNSELQSDSIYDDLIMDHYRNPRNRNPINRPDIDHHDWNPFCGDEVHINFEINNQNLDYESQFTNLVEKYGGTVGNTVVFASQGIIEGLGHIIVIFLFTFYLISDGNKWRAALRNNLSSSFWKIIDEVWNVGVSKAAGFTVAKFILGVFACLVLSIGFLFLLPDAKDA